MAPSPYRVFLSAASLDLRTFRQAAAETLQRCATNICSHGPLELVYQEDFRLDYQEIWRVLRQKILNCDAVICLVGFAFGLDRPTAQGGSRRRSYSQLEFDLATDLGKPVFVFLAEEATLLDVHDAEVGELRNLQLEFRNELMSSEKIRYSFSTKDDLLGKLARLQLPPREELRRAENLPYKSLGALFKGREGFLRELQQKLSEEYRRAVGVLATHAIYGLGGIGKTRVAIEYAWRNESHYTALLFVTADSPANLRRNLAELVGPMVLDLRDVQEAKEEEVRVAGALHWLETHAGWLLLLDNVDTEEAAQAVEALLPRLRRGHVVITSCVRAWGKGVEPLELDLLDSDAATDFLLERTSGRRQPTQTDERDAANLAALLDGLALALEQAGAFISHVRCTLAEYAERWRKQEEQVLTWFDSRQMKYPRSVAVTWETTWNRLTQSARALLEILAWLAPDPVPQWVLNGQDGNPEVQDILGETDSRLALAELEKYSLLKREVTESESALTVHRLVQEMNRRQLGPDKRRLQQALNLINAVAQGDPQDVQSWPTLKPLAPHIAVLVERAAQNGISQPTTRLMNQLGLLFQAQALFAPAEPLMRQALHIDERTFGPDHPEVAIRLNNLAMLLRDTNRLAEAEPVMRRALEIDRRTFGTDHPNVARGLNNLAQLLKDSNRLAEAESLMRAALDIDERTFGADHPIVAIRLNNLAQLLQATNRSRDAEPLQRRALEIVECSFGADHPNVAIRLNNLAALLWATNRLSEAEPLMRRALDIDERSFGADHPKVAIRLNNLAQLLQVGGRLVEAEPLMRRALDIDKRSFGPEHPNVAIRLSNLAVILKDTNRLADAEALMRRALDIDERAWDAYHPSVARDLNNLAMLLNDTNRPAEGEPLMRRALDIDEHAFGPQHPDVARDLNNLAMLLQAQNRLVDAEVLMRRALEIDESSFAADHPNISRDLNNLAMLLQGQNRPADAESLIRRALDINERSFGANHPRVAIDLSNLGRILQATSRLAQAESLVRRALDIDQRSFGPDHPNVAIRLNNLARLLQDTRRHAEAEPLMRRGLFILFHFQALTGHEHPNFRAGLGNYRRLLEAMDFSPGQISQRLQPFQSPNAADVPLTND